MMTNSVNFILRFDEGRVIAYGKFRALNGSVIIDKISLLSKTSLRLLCAEI